MNNEKITIATQTEDNTNKGLGWSAIRPEPLNRIYPLSNTANMPQYRKNFSQVFEEEFVAEATQKDWQMTPIIKLIRDKDWETLKKVSPFLYSLKRDLSITPSGCILYDNRLMVPSSLKQLVINSLHQTHPGQAGMLQLVPSSLKQLVINSLHQTHPGQAGMLQLADLYVSLGSIGK